MPDGSDGSTARSIFFREQVSLARDASADAAA